MKQLSLLSRAIKVIAMIGLVVLAVSVSGDRSLQAQAPPPQAIIDNGTVQLGVNPEGNLIVPGGTLPRSDNDPPFPEPPAPDPPIADVGLRFIPTNGEALARGCPCEGYGVANADPATMTFSAFANKSQFGSPSNMVVQSGTAVTNSSGHTKAESVGSAFKSVVTAGGRLRVTHDIHPSPVSPNLYEIDVTLQNVGVGAIGDVRYRRVIDFDVPPTTFFEHVEIHIPPEFDGILFRATTDGFDTADPLFENDPNAGDPPTTLSYENGTQDYVGGPTDQGALFDLTFGSLQPGESSGEDEFPGPGEAKAFTIYYGAAASRAEALKAISDVGATAYALGIPSTSFAPDAPADNNDNVFIFAYGETGDGTYDRTWHFTGAGGGAHSLSLRSDGTPEEDDLAVTAEEDPFPEPFAQGLFPFDVLQPMGPTPGFFTLYKVSNSPPLGFGAPLRTYIARDANTIADPPCRPRLLHLYSTGPLNGMARDETVEYYPRPPVEEGPPDLFADLELGPLVDDPGIGSQSDGFGGQWQSVDIGDPESGIGPDDPLTDRFDAWVTPNPDGSTVVNRGSTLVVKFRYTPGPPPGDPRLSVAKLDDSVQGFEPVTFAAPGESFKDNVFKCDPLKLECRINFKTTKLTQGTYTASVNSLSFCVQDVQFGVRTPNQQ